MNNRSKYNVLVVTPSEIIAAGVGEILLRSREFVLFGSIPDVSLYSESKFEAVEVVLVDPQVASWESRGEVRRRLGGRGVPVLALIVGVGDDSLLRNFDGVVSIYDSADMVLSRLSAAVEQSAAPQNRNEGDELSSRERDILTAVARGKTNKEIADELNLSVHTVMTHRKNISHKLGINSISDLTVYAILNTLIDVTDY